MHKIPITLVSTLVIPIPLMTPALPAQSPDSLVVEGELGSMWVTSSDIAPLAKGRFRMQFDGARAHVRLDLPGVGRFEHGDDGELVWEIDPVAGPAIREGFAATASRRVFALLRGDVAGARATYAEESALDDGEIELRTAGTDAPDTWYTTDSGRVRKVELQTRSALDEPAEWVVSFREPADHDGFSFPREIRWYAAHLRFDLRVGKLSRDPADVDTAAFSLDPKLVANARELAAARTAIGTKKPICEIVVNESQPVLRMRKTIEAANIAQELGTILPAVMQYVTKAGGATAGAPYTRYHTFEGGKIDLECGIPVVTALDGDGAIEAGTLPGGRAVTTWHIGPYTTLAQSHTRVQAWIAEHELEAAGGIWEIYWTDPGLEPDPQKWRTQLVQPVE